jgi:hypothetical protein
VSGVAWAGGAQRGVNWTPEDAARQHTTQHMRSNAGARADTTPTPTPTLAPAPHT